MSMLQTINSYNHKYYGTILIEFKYMLNFIRLKIY